MSGHKVVITLYRWAGAWGPFKVKIPCGECTLTKDVILDTVAHELGDIPVELEIREWLTEWWKPLLKGGWHAPIVMVDGKVISQGHALNRGLLTQAVTAAYASKAPIQRSHLFGKASCPHCQRAKAYLDKAGIQYTYHDVVRSPRALYEMLARVKPLVGPKTPITVPQIWLGGQYIGGADRLEQVMRDQGLVNQEALSSLSHMH
ncbi:glutaredoxin [Acaryochloris sp. IP29b_bin.148]|uniref:glutaredoxin family protein n=1 Tax=Acaryochloris sp. IP29b_bin.148 TaxID=2969218 RepID=UPI00263A133F|nr:glutaredoxin [Acaryochloris sp. IP29b_bin.148]